MRDPLDTREWAHHCKSMRSKLGVSKMYKPWTDSMPPHQVVGAPSTCRIHELVNLSWAARKPRERTLPWFTDLSQCVSRKPWWPECPCINTSSMIFDHEQERVWGVEEKMAALGWPISRMAFPASMTTAQQHDLVGESMCAPCIVLATFLNEAPWWGRHLRRQTSKARSSQVQAAAPPPI